jgi:hypothetical protein
MSELARALGNHGPIRFAVDALGQTWYLSTAPQYLKAQYEEWMEQRAEERIEARRAGRGDEWYFNEIEKFHDRRDSGNFEWKGPVFYRLLMNTKGIPYLLHLLLQRHHADKNGDPLVSEEQAKAMYDANSEGFIKAIKQIVDDAPNSQPPGEPAATENGSASVKLSPSS